MHCCSEKAQRRVRAQFVCAPARPQQALRRGSIVVTQNVFEFEEVLVKKKSRIRSRVPLFVGAGFICLSPGCAGEEQKEIGMCDEPSKWSFVWCAHASSDSSSTTVRYLDQAAHAQLQYLEPLVRRAGT